MERFELYSGDVILEYDDAEHLYSVSGEPVDFTGSMCQKYFPAPWAIPWGKKVMREAAIAEYKKFAREICELLETGATVKTDIFLDEVRIKELEKRLNAATYIKSDRALLIGDLVHEFAHKWATGENPEVPVNEDAARACEAFQEQFWFEYEVEPIAAEQKVFSKKYNYAGTLDLDANTCYGRSIIDYKTTSNLRSYKAKPEYFSQCGGYAAAREEEGYGPYENILIVEIDRESGDVRVNQLTDVDSAFTSFRACMFNHRFAKNISATLKK